MGDVFTARVGETFVTFNITGLIPNTKIVWTVVNCYQKATTSGLCQLQLNRRRRTSIPSSRRREVRGAYNRDVNES